MLQQLPKSERLSGKINLDNLFTKGSSFIEYPLRIVYIITERTDASTVKILPGVSKKRFKKAVDRNRIKRLIRESYRLNKAEITDHFHRQNKCIHIAFFCISPDLPEFGLVQKKMKNALSRIIEKTPIKNTDDKL